MKALHAVGKTLRDLLPFMFPPDFCILVRAICKPVHREGFADSRRITESGKNLRPIRLKGGATESPESLRSA